MKKSKRKFRVRNKIKKVNKNRLRLSIFRSSKNIYAQIIDDNISKTVVSASSKDKDVKKETKSKKGDMSKIVAKNLFKKAAAWVSYANDVYSTLFTIAIFEDERKFVQSRFLFRAHCYPIVI